MLTFFSPAKINLYLKIIDKRSDGFHTLSSLLQTLSLGDRLQMALSKEDLFSCSDPHLPLDHRNLVIKALDLFRKKTGISHPLFLHLEKNVPMQAGLGGGSGNAATLLWACSELFKLNLPIPLLIEWGAEIGSDVPFFFSEGTALCTGRGEHVMNLAPLQQKESLLIVKPALGLSTKLIFDHYARLKGSSSICDHECRLERFLKGEMEGFNDLEEPAFHVSPKLRDLKNALLKGGFSRVMMTGAGSSFFCFSEGQLPTDPSLSFYPVTFLNRKEGSWYQEKANEK